MTKIYTRTGDTGQTSLFDGTRVSKADVRVETYGTVDELNAVLGALIAALPETHAELVPELLWIQRTLLKLGGWLASTAERANHLPSLKPAYSERLEQNIDRMDQHLAPLQQLILPNGHPTAAWAHMARTVCRRAERRLVQWGELVDLDNPNETYQTEFAASLIYLNRLSDYLFVLARTCNRLAGIDDIPWTP